LPFTEKKRGGVGKEIERHPLPKVVVQVRPRKALATTAKKAIGECNVVKKTIKSENVVDEGAEKVFSERARGRARSGAHLTVGPGKGGTAEKKEGGTGKVAARLVVKPEKTPFKE